MTTKIIPFNQLPVCAQTCPALNAANDVCVPPAVPESDTQTYTNCICQGTQLAGLYNDPRAVCTEICTSDSDLQAIQSAFTQLCGQQQDSANPSPTSSAAPGASTTSAATTGARPAAEEQSWIAGHWQWIVFVAILIIAMVGFSILGVWLKKRHRRKVDARNANVASNDAIPPPTAGASNPSVNEVTRDSQTREMTGPTGMMGMASGVAPPRRGFAGRSTRSRSSTVNSTNGPVAWGPHQNMAASRYENVPPSPVYTGTHDYPDRTYSPAAANARNVPYVDTNVPPGTALSSPGAEASPVSPVDEKMGGRNINGAGAQRIREMQSQESINRTKSGTPVSMRSGDGRSGTPNSAGRLRKI